MALSNFLQAGDLNQMLLGSKEIKKTYKTGVVNFLKKNSAVDYATKHWAGRPGLDHCSDTISTGLGLCTIADAIQSSFQYQKTGWAILSGIGIYKRYKPA
jgi:hypothetical protein